MPAPGPSETSYLKPKELFLYRRWPWHVLFWTGYFLFRLYVYYITVTYYQQVYLEYMLLSEIFVVLATYFTLWLYKRLFHVKKYLLYFLIGAALWVLCLYLKTVFQFHYLRNEVAFQGNSFSDIFLNNFAVVLFQFFFLTSCKYFKDGYIAQHFDAERKNEQLLAEVNNLKSQIAPHFLFNTLNNLYGLAVSKSDKLPVLMLQLSQLLRHTLYETQKPLVFINEEIGILMGYIQLESVRLEDNLKLTFDNTIPANSPYQIAPLLLIVFMENAFKHSKLVQSKGIEISVKTRLDDDLFNIIITNNYNAAKPASDNGIGLFNVKQRLKLLYPHNQHHLLINKDDGFYTINLSIKLTQANQHGE